MRIDYDLDKYPKINSEIGRPIKINNKTEIKTENNICRLSAYVIKKVIIAELTSNWGIIEFKLEKDKSSGILFLRIGLEA